MKIFTIMDKIDQMSSELLYADYNQKIIIFEENYQLLLQIGLGLFSEDRLEQYERTLNERIVQIKNDFNLIANYLYCFNPENNGGLYHSVNIERSFSFLIDGKIPAYTSQKTSKSGIPVVDVNDNSFIISKGLSLSRDLFFAKQWKYNGVIFVFDRDQLKNKYKVEPISWQGQRKEFESYKEEREEFLIIHKTNRSGKNYENEEFMKEFNEIKKDFYYWINEPESEERDSFLHFFHAMEERINYNDVDFLNQSGGFVDLNDSFFIGFTLNYSIVEEFMFSRFFPYEKIKFLLSHPKFLGFVE